MHSLPTAGTRLLTQSQGWHHRCPSAARRQHKRHSAEQQWLACPYLDVAAIRTAEGRAEFGRRYTASVFGWMGPLFTAAVETVDERERFKTDLSAALARRAEELQFDYAVAVVIAKRR